MPVRYYSFDGFVVDLKRRVLTRSGQPVRLTSRTFNVLIALLERGAGTISKDELADTVWRESAIGDGTISQQIWMLRQALNEQGEQRYIVTIPSHGYRFVGDVYSECDVVSIITELLITFNTHACQWTSCALPILDACPRKNESRSAKHAKMSELAAAGH